MDFWFLDYEIYYSKEYSLKKMTPPEYILDPRFECTGVAVKEGLAGAPYWVDGPDVQKFFDGIDKDRSVFVSHNALFDAAITSWVYGTVPRLTVDTLGMSRAVLGHKLRSHSLASVAKHFELGPKTDTILKVEGMNAAAIKAAGLWPAYTEYALNDVELCAQIYDRLRPSFPTSELAVMDAVLRCAIAPKFKLDTLVLHEHLHNVKTAKANLLAQIGGDREHLMSNDKFAAALQALGVDPPRKVSLTTGKETWAFAKTDHEFIELEEHENPQVQALVAARLGVKTALEESRTQSFINISRLTWRDNKQGWMPLPLRYAGAHTHRLCLAGGTIIAVLRDERVIYSRLDNLRDTDLVWDGEAFVSHGGLSYAGIKKVIEYDGVVGTPDHRVWTVEHGYCALADAKARGYRIARGELPDPTRIDPTVQRTSEVSRPDQVYLCKVRGGDALQVGGHTRPSEGLVPPLPHERADGRGDTFQGNAQSRGSGQYKGYRAEACDVERRRDPVGETAGKVTGQNTCEEVAGSGMESRHVYSSPGAAEVHEPTGVELHLLRRPGDRVQVSFDADNGGLDIDASGDQAAGALAGPHRLQRPLRAGEPSLGCEGNAGSQSVFVPTWDVVDCGPRNRFMANGKVVHNSGDWKINMQNLPRGGALRRALIAPPGHVVLAPDAAQIEARINAWISGQKDLVTAFANDQDIYSEFASLVFGYPVAKKTHPKERFLGKTSILGLGYQMGWVKFQTTVKTQSRLQLGEEINLSDADSMKTVNTYRSKMWRIGESWKLLQGPGLNALAGYGMFQFGPCTFQKEAILLPNGLRLHYEGLKFENNEWWFTYGGKPKKLYGGKILENIVQALARIVVMDAALRINKRLADFGVELAGQVHDELIYIVPEDVAEVCKAIMLEEMARPPAWAPDLPLKAEADMGLNYGDAK